MTPRASNRLAWVLWAIGLGALVGAFTLDVATHRPDDLSPITQMIAFLATGITGLVIARKQPANAIGWLYLAVWVSVGMVFAAVDSFAYWATITHPGVPGGTFAVWLTNWAWVPVFAVFLTFPFLLFPDGHLPSPRWRPVAWAGAIVTVLWAVAFALENHDFTDATGHHVRNPYTIRSQIPLFDGARQVLAFAFLVVLGLSIVSLVVRFRRSHGDEREQIKWLMIAATITLVWLALPFEHGNGGPIDFVQGFILALIPISVGIAILKYRLYDLDIVIRKTLMVGAMALFISLVYALIVGLGSQLFDSSALSFIAAAVLAIGFQPARDRARKLADRLVYGRRATPYESSPTSPAAWKRPTLPTTCSRAWRRCSPPAPAPRARSSG